MNISKCIDYIKKYKGNAKDASLLLAQDGDLSVYYSPFDYINKEAKIVIVGITPGEQQSKNAFEAAQAALQAGKTNAEILQLAKETGSFSGPMRKNLVDMLNYFQLNKVLHIENCESLFGANKNLVHYASCLRYPVFFRGKNYNGTPKAIRNKLLQEQLKNYFTEELALLSGAIIIPLGSKVTENILYLVSLGLVKEDNILIGFQHPSGANNERINYLIGKKAKKYCSVKTNTDMIDKDRIKLQLKIQKLM